MDNICCVRPDNQRVNGWETRTLLQKHIPKMKTFGMNFVRTIKWYSLKNYLRNVDIKKELKLQLVIDRRKECRQDQKALVEHMVVVHTSKQVLEYRPIGRRDCRFCKQWSETMKSEYSGKGYFTRIYSPPMHLRCCCWERICEYGGDALLKLQGDVLPLRVAYL